MGAESNRLRAKAVPIRAESTGSDVEAAEPSGERARTRAERVWPEAQSARLEVPSARQKVEAVRPNVDAVAGGEEFGNAAIFPLERPATFLRPEALSPRARAAPAQTAASIAVMARVRVAHQLRSIGPVGCSVEIKIVRVAHEVSFVGADERLLRCPLVLATRLLRPSRGLGMIDRSPQGLAMTVGCYPSV
jgi:hypothetical protein